MKTKTLLVLALLIASITCQQKVVKGCFIWNPKTNTCFMCDRRQVTANECGPLLPPTDTCHFYAKQPG